MGSSGRAVGASVVPAELFEQFLEFAPDGIVGVGVDGLIALANSQTEELFGCSRGELLGQPIELLVPERFHAAHPRHRAGYFADPRTRPMGAKLELYGRRKDGSEFPAEISLSSIVLDTGMLAIAAIRDVTSRVEAQRKFEQFVEFAPDGIVGVGIEGRIELANAQTEALFGHKRADLIGQPVELLVPERFHAVHPGHRTGYFDDPRTRPMGAELELYGRRKDGSEFPAEISLSSIVTSDGVLGIAAIRDISERIEAEGARRELEQRLEQSRRVDSEREKEALEAQLNQLRRLESVGQLAGGIAHDFNNLLGVIINYAQFVTEEISEDSPVLEDVAEIRRAAERAAELTRQLLIFSRRESVRPQVIDLNGIVSEMDRLLRRALGEQIKLETRFAPGLWSVNADPGQIEQVLVNLAVNARDAMPGGGRLLLETANVELDDQLVASGSGSAIPPGRYARLAVSDTGVGMAPEIVRRVFEPFFSTKPRGEGTGLGLTTVYGIVTDAGGNVSIYSEEGIGTTIKVHLPASEAVPRAKQSAPASRPRAHGETVLVVEDEPGIRLLVERILKRAGYRVLMAASGSAALEICARPGQAIDLLLTDVVMPEMQGPEVAARLVALRPELKVLFMSGYVHQVISDPAGMPAETFEFIEKPFTAETLLTSVRGALDPVAPDVTDG